MLSNRFRNFAMEIDVVSKITSTTILQHKKYPISSLHNTKQNKTKNPDQKFTPFIIIIIITRNQKLSLKQNLDRFVESDDVGMIDGSEDRNLLEETVSDFRVKQFLINLLDGDF